VKTNSTLDRNICENNIIYERCAKDEVVLLEDSVQISEAVHDVIEKQLGGSVIDVKSKEEVFEIVKNKQVTWCILDNWINSNKNEGLKALEQIRSIDPNIFTTIYSAHPSEEIKRRAINLGANCFKTKSTNPYQDIKEITSEFLKYKLYILNNQIREQLLTLELEVENLEIDTKAEEYEECLINDKMNFDAYQKAKEDFNWLKKYQNQYVAFVDGKLLGSDVVKEQLLQWLSSSEFINQKRFIVRVEENKENIVYIDEPSSLWQDFA
jgi:DNA-binding NarL/FixJ family response regulator